MNCPGVISSFVDEKEDLFKVYIGISKKITSFSKNPNIQK
jgi:hypothetical protein